VEALGMANGFYSASICGEAVDLRTIIWELLF